MITEKKSRKKKEGEQYEKKGKVPKTEKRGKRGKGEWKRESKEGGEKISSRISELDKNENKIRMAKRRRGRWWT